MKKLLAVAVLILTALSAFGQGVRIQAFTTNSGPVVTNIVVSLSSNLQPNRLRATNTLSGAVRIWAATSGTNGFWLDPATITPGAATNVAWPVRGSNTVLTTNGFEVTINAITDTNVVNTLASNIIGGSFISAANGTGYNTSLTNLLATTNSAGLEPALLVNGNSTFWGNIVVEGTGDVSAQTFSGGLFIGIGSSLSALNASSVSSGTLHPARMATNTPFSGSFLKATSPSTTAWSKDGSTLTNITGNAGGATNLLNAGGQVVIYGNSMEMVDPNTGWTNANWSDQTLSQSNTNVLDWFNKRLIGPWLIDIATGNAFGQTNNALEAPVGFAVAIADSVLEQNKFTFSGGPISGKHGWATGEDYGDNYLADTLLAIIGRPSYFSASNVWDLAYMFSELQEVDGYIPEAVTSGGAPAGSAAGHWVDNVSSFVGLCYEHYLRTGQPTAYTTFFGTISNGFRYMGSSTISGRNLTNELVYLRFNTNQAFIFDTPNVPEGYSLGGSLWLYNAYGELSEMARAANESSNSVYFLNRQIAMRASAATNLWNAQSNGYNAFTLGSRTNICYGWLNGMAVAFGFYTNATVANLVSSNLFTWYDGEVECGIPEANDAETRLRCLPYYALGLARIYPDKADQMYRDALRTMMAGGSPNELYEFCAPGQSARYINSATSVAQHWRLSRWNPQLQFLGAPITGGASASASSQSSFTNAAFYGVTTNFDNSVTGLGVVTTNYFASDNSMGVVRGGSAYGIWYLEPDNGFPWLFVDFDGVKLGDKVYGAFSLNVGSPTSGALDNGTLTWTGGAYGNLIGGTNIQEAGLNYWGTNPPAGQILGSTSSNTPAWFTAAQLGISGGGGGPFSGGFTNGSGVITADGHAMELIDPSTGWTNLNWSDQIASTDGTNVFDWFNKYLIGNWTVTNGAFSVVGPGPGEIDISDAAGGESVTLTVPATLASNYTITLPTTNGADGNVLGLAGGALAWVPAGSGTPGGSDTQVQFNDGGVFGGDAGLTYLKSQDTLLVGSGNSASGSRGFVSGANNVVGSSGINNGFIGGGTDNFLDAGSSSHTSILGGQQNTNLSLFNGVLIGGRFNKIFAVSTGSEALLGGAANQIGGTFSTITGGRTNSVFGSYSIALGGLLNVVSNHYATAGGFKTRAMHEGSWIWADHSLDAETVTVTSNSFNVRANGGVYISTTNGLYLNGSQITPGGGFTNMMTGTISYGTTITPDLDIAGLVQYATTPRRITFRCTLTGNITTVAAPTGTAVDGDVMVWEMIQDGTGNRTITGFDSIYAFGSDITGITLSTSASKRDFVSWTYNSAATKWFCTGFVRGY